jgi:hypothetical protein
MQWGHTHSQLLTGVNLGDAGCSRCHGTSAGTNQESDGSYSRSSLEQMSRELLLRSLLHQRSQLRKPRHFQTEWLTSFNFGCRMI